MREAWSGDTVPFVLKEKGNYDINLLPDCITTINNTRFIEDQCDNIAHAPEYAVKYNYFEQFGILHATLKPQEFLRTISRGKWRRDSEQTLDVTSFR